MPLAFVLISSEIGTENEVLKKLQQVENVVEAHVVYGVYDIVVKVKAETVGKLKETVTSKIRGLDKVKSTLTMIVTEST